MEGGMSYDSVQAAVPESANVTRTPRACSTWSSPAARWRRSTSCPGRRCVTCRKGPRSSALVYLYAGLKAGATAEEVIARAEEDEAPFAASDELKSWVTEGLRELSAR